MDIARKRPLEEYVRSITVEDASGARYEVHEFRADSFLLGGRRFQLDNGEGVQLMSDNTFKVVLTGEVLVPI